VSTLNRGELASRHLEATLAKNLAAIRLWNKLAGATSQHGATRATRGRAPESMANRPEEPRGRPSSAGRGWAPTPSRTSRAQRQRAVQRAAGGPTLPPIRHAPSEPQAREGPSLPPNAGPAATSAQAQAHTHEAQNGLPNLLGWPIRVSLHLVEW